jgi:hypothetical protein
VVTSECGLRSFAENVVMGHGRAGFIVGGGLGLWIGVDFDGFSLCGAEVATCGSYGN